MIQLHKIPFKTYIYKNDFFIFYIKLQKKNIQEKNKKF